MNTIISITEAQIPTPSGEQLTDEEKAAQLHDATAALFASVFDAPQVTGNRAKALIEARQAKAAGAALSALFTTMHD